MEKPLLLIDIDGVISLFGYDPSSPPAGRFEMVDGIAHFLSATAGEHLRELSAEFELAWCSGWEEKANEYLIRALGLPSALPHLVFDTRPIGAEAGGNLGADHWKLAAIDEYAGPGRPLAWIDDDQDDRCTTWAASRRAQTLLIRTDPAVGLTREHVLKLLAWAREL
jgi:hypothetical protein